MLCLQHFEYTYESCHMGLSRRCCASSCLSSFLQSLEHWSSRCHTTDASEQGRLVEHPQLPHLRF